MKKMTSDDELIRAHREILANRGIIAYVDVWQDDIMNYSELWQEKLIDMGAKVVKKWNKNITHLVYKDGRPGMRFKKFSLKPDTSRYSIRRKRNIYSHYP